MDVGNDENDRTLVEEYARNKAQITVVTFLHKQVFQTNALARTWYKPRDMSALEHMVQGRVPWLEAKKHDKVSIGIVNVHQATAKRHDLQWQVTYLVRAMTDAATTQRQMMGGDFNAALSPYFYSIIFLPFYVYIYDKVDKFFQDFVHSTHGTLIQSEAHTRRNLLKGSSASLDHIMMWNLMCANTCTMQGSTSKDHWDGAKWDGAKCNDHTFISCTVGADLPTYQKRLGSAV